MFTLTQLKEANLKIRTGADFPAYVQELIHLGVTSYETYVTDGRTLFFGNDNYSRQSEVKYPLISIAYPNDPENFKNHLKEHQQGKTHYLTFCKQAAKAGVEKWITSIETMTCTYFDKKGNEVFSEPIPTISKKGSPVKTSR